MPYGEIRVDTITFTNGGVDTSITVSGLAASTTGNLTVTGTISGATVRATTVSGVTVTGTTVQGASGTFTSITGGVATITSGVFAAGSAAAPSISFTSDANTGIYSPGADQVAISTNGTGRLFVDASGRVGIGTASPITTLDCRGPGAFVAENSFLGLDGTTGIRLGLIKKSGQAPILAAGSATAFIFAHSSGTDIIDPSNQTYTERLRITSAGLVGIGTSVPTARLHVSGDDMVLRSSGGIDGDLFISSGYNASNYFVARLRSDFNGKFSISTGLPALATNEVDASVTTAITIDSSQRVGIGTTNVSSLLHLRTANSGTPQAALRIEQFNAAATRGHRLEITVDPDNDIVRYNATGDGAGNHVFQTGGNERARIDSSGRLLVGTSTARANFYNSTGTPQVQVESTGSDGSSLSLTTNFTTATPTASPNLSLARSGATSLGSNTLVAADNALGNINFLGADGSEFVTAAQIQAFVDGTPGANDMPGRLVFSTTADGAGSPTERMRIASNGVITIQNGAVAVIGTLTDGATITPDFAADCNFTVTLGGNRTIANPTNITAGQSGSIFLVQDATGSRTVSWGSSWDFPGGTAPTLSTAANAVDRIDYIVRSSTSIHTVFTANYS